MKGPEGTRDREMQRSDASGSLSGSKPTTGAGLAFLDRPQEEVFQRRGRVRNTLHRSAMLFQYGLNFTDGLGAQLRRHDLSLVAALQEVLHISDDLQLSAVQNRDAVADVLDVGEQVAAHDDRLAVGLQLQDEVLHVASTERIETA